MQRRTFKELIESRSFLLTEGAVNERLNRNPNIQLPEHVRSAGLLSDPVGREALEGLYREYLDIGKRFELPMAVLTPTWRAGPDQVRREGLSSLDQVNQDSVAFLSGIRERYGAYAAHIFIGGLIGCRGDAYNPAASLTIEQAHKYHRPQADALVQAGVDFGIAETLPALAEAAGMALVFSDLNVPYILGFVLRPEGTLLDQTPLHTAINTIDHLADSPPCCYIANCIHPSVFASALAREEGHSVVLERVQGLQGNTSRLRPEELDGLPYLDMEDPDIFSAQMVRLNREFGINILGGCCGTDSRHISAIAEAMCSPQAPL